MCGLDAMKIGWIELYNKTFSGDEFMKLFHISDRLFEEPIGDLGGGGGDNSETSLAIIPAGGDTSSPATTDTPAASGEPGSDTTAVTKFSRPTIHG